ncbi:MASE1 domain-containing protein [Streptomyces kunmingensis]|uniref:MASE1 domain-containing protein n=1 Tax=Streptomyces kunmingensis TaxID=68225 RepID=A0ABU6CJT8_9ACTN|nr:MASE1 domain-containing protein [Streptomyces kunmingensis]MEB3964990.1 MASE1 domain-containing protein [Streptomyces kunmingensis]
MAAVLVTRPIRLSVEPVLKALAVAACYYVAGRLGLLGRLVVEGVVVTPIWPPTGVAVAALLVYGVRAWPGIALGSFLVIMSLTTPRATTLLTVLGNTAGPLCAMLLLRRVRFRLDISRLRDGLALVLAGLGAMLVSATAGVGLQVLTGALETGEFWSVWLAWWVGDTMGVLLITPLLLVLVGAAGRMRRGGWTELVCLVLAAAILVPVAALSRMSLLYLVFPLLIWAALRFQLAGSMLCALFASVLTTFEANAREGAFEQLSAVEIMIKLQAFNGAVALTAVLLSAMVTEQRATRRSVENACDELAEVLEHLAAGGAPPEPSTSHAIGTDADDAPRRRRGSLGSRHGPSGPA